MSLKQWNSTMDIDLTSSFLVTREDLRGLQATSENVKDYASIIFMGSCAGKFGNHLAFLLEATLKFEKKKRRRCRPCGLCCCQKWCVVQFNYSISDMLTDMIGMMYGLTRSLKNEIVKIAPEGRVNCIAPGWTRTVCHIHFHHRRRLLRTVVSPWQKNL